MTDSPDQIRAEIEKTRRELGGDVDALADKVSPSKIVDRQTDKVKHAWVGARPGHGRRGRHRVRRFRSRVVAEHVGCQGQGRRQGGG